MGVNTIDKVMQPALAQQCLDMCRHLITVGVGFTFNQMDHSFHFSMDSKEKVSPAAAKPGSKKRVSPSTKRRSERRRILHLSKARQIPSLTPGVEALSSGLPSDAATSGPPEVTKNICDLDHKCNDCEFIAKTKNGLKIHKARIHERERLRSSSSANTSMEPPFDQDTDSREEEPEEPEEEKLEEEEEEESFLIEEEVDKEEEEVAGLDTGLAVAAAQKDPWQAYLDKLRHEYLESVKKRKKKEEEKRKKKEEKRK